jgi:dGTP triphosphohydrolase
LVALLPEKAPGCEDGSAYQRLLLVLDYLSSMTDNNAFALYQKLKGISL